ncbi:hypothetical protein DFP72DRAFT_895934 [Ephemerocybe angulata]|uniref:C2H2-type domain-containing protein n=1 Tax=Ephemerocybe angulata TaxID=980116 RepID=A0A8H6I141_9AGAR|nr:hypothetical protein DFP72DRAFT_895934 [Tulosesus angulatus]
MPATSSQSNGASSSTSPPRGPCPSSEVTCPRCWVIITHHYDLKRHLKKCDPKPESYNACTYDGCSYKTIQMGNLQAHIRAIHTKEKPHVCPEAECEYRSSNAAGLHRHRKNRHGYVPRTVAQRNRRWS